MDAHTTLEAQNGHRAIRGSALTPYQFHGALVTGAFISDAFTLGSHQHDCRQIFAKGYCLSLDDSEALQNAVGRMHPSIRAQVTYDGRLYALPASLIFSFYSIDRDGWTEAGLTDADIPQSFPQLLDFLERWCDRQVSGDSLGIRVKGSWEAELYKPSSYTAWLTGLLIHNHMIQAEHAGEPLRFHTPEILALLERIVEIGPRIYQSEPSMSEFASGAGRQLFSDAEPGNYGAL